MVPRDRLGGPPFGLLGSTFQGGFVSEVGIGIEVKKKMYRQGSENRDKERY